MNITGALNYEPNIMANVSSEEDVVFANPSGAFGITKSTWVQSNGVSNGAPEWYHDRAITFDASKSWSGETSEVGSNTPHNNLPPYIAVYLFKRTA